MMGADSDFIEKYLEHYSKTQGVLPEKIEEFGEKYREQGFLTQDQLYDIAYESSTRSAYHVRKNPERLCREVTENILKMKGDYSQIALISSLSGFKAPTASCILTAMDPERHTIVDTRVWASLERLDYLEGRKESFDAKDYVEMIEAVRKISDKTGFTASEVGYALFAYDDDVRDGTLH
jgi:thermostable 8-oxoguanine DNA glycosylase